MTNGIGQAKKLGKHNRQWPGVANESSIKTWLSSNCHDKLNENIDKESKDSIFSNKYSIKNSAVQDATDDIIQTKPVSRPHTTNVLDTNISFDNEYQSFETPRGNNHGTT